MEMPQNNGYCYETYTNMLLPQK